MDPTRLSRTNAAQVGRIRRQHRAGGESVGTRGGGMDSARRLEEVSQVGDWR